MEVPQQNKYSKLRTKECNNHACCGFQAKYYFVERTIHFYFITNYVRVNRKDFVKATLVSLDNISYD